ncbi:MAG: hypothetical protein Q9216_001627 [Gyalolechia sp. 2 TL-2023]
MKMTMIPLFVILLTFLTPHTHAQQQQPPSRNPRNNDPLLSANLLGSHFGIPGIPATYDYVIVGGGTAGLTLARRLAANTSVTVAVIEAGGLYETDNGNLTQIPAFATYWVDGGPPRNPLVDWYQTTEPQPVSEGSRGSYDKWAEQVGDASYRFDNFLPWFRRSVRFTPPSAGRLANSTPKYDAADERFEGGPLEIGFPSWANAISSWIARSLDSLRVRELPGLLGGDLLGWSYVTETISTVTQTRSSSESSYLREALRQTTNLQVYKSTLAKKVGFDSSLRVESVTVDSGGFEYQINAEKEIILSAGADHVLFGTVYPVNLITHSQLMTDPALLARSVVEYNERRSGILTNCGGDLLGKKSGFEKLAKDAVTAQTRADLDATFGKDWPDIELLFFDGDLVGVPPDSRNYVSSLAGLVAPFSRGNITINSTDTSFNPVVSPNWLSDPRDQEIAVAGLRRAREILQTESMQPILGGPEVFPGSNVTSERDILAAIKKSASSINHAAGTCAMGKSTDPNAVVDSRARVIGVEGLRVVDASAFPFLPPGHPQSTVYALAEKIADDILRGR